LYDAAKNFMADQILWLIKSLFLLCFFLSCKNFYMAVNPSKGSKGASVDSLKNLNRYFILRSGGQAFYLKNMTLSDDRKILTATPDTLAPNHKLHLVNGRNGKQQYKKYNELEIAVLNEVHFYAPTVQAKVGESFQLPLDQVQKIEVIEKDRKRTTNSYVIGAIGYTLGAFVVAAIIVAATKSSCPFVSAYDGTDFALQGEIYGGAIYPQMARHDYLPLKMAPLADGSLQLKITNELKEKQYTDIAKLLVIKHSPSTRMMVDEAGQLYSVGSPVSAEKAVLSNGRNLLQALQKDGDNAIAYMDDTASSDASNSITLNFPNKKTTDEAKLVLTLKNSYWLDQLYGELAKGFGKYYSTYIKKQAKKPAAELVRWTRDQQIPLTVSIQTDHGWKQLAELSTIGPLANRNTVIPVDLSGINDKQITIRLSSGFQFWEIDYAGLDFTPANAYSVEKLDPVQATDETDKNVLTALQKEDGIYLEQPQIGNSATVVYKPKSLGDASKSYTYILHTKGYYQHIREFTNKPDVGFLKQFTKPNAFPLYGKLLYKKLEKESLRLMASTTNQ
jgi:hypothetical protein